MPTRTLPFGGSGSGSFPSTRSRSWAKAGVWSGSPDRPRPFPILQHAREIFERLQAAPALSETDTLLEQTTLLSS